jgi:ABC-type multidrug transport system fused ATPase/permease subunit
MNSSSKIAKLTSPSTSKPEGPSTHKDQAAGNSEVRSLYQDFKGLKKLWPYLREYKRLIFIAALLIPVISGLQMALPLIIKRTIDEGILKNNGTVLLYGASFYLLAVLGEYITRAGQSITTALAVHRMIRKMRANLVTQVMRLKASFHDQSLSGALVTRATSDFDNLSESLNMGVLTSVVDIAVLGGCVIGMFIMSWPMALCAILILPLVAWIVRGFSKGLKAAMLKTRKKIAALNAFTQECFYGHSTIKLLTAEAAAEKRYNQLNIEFRDAQMDSVILDSMMFSILDGIASITVGLVLWLGITQLLDIQLVTAGVMVAFVQYIQQLFEPLKNLGNKMAMLQGAFTSIDRVFGVLDLKDWVGGHVPSPKIKGSVRFEHVSFSYDKSRANAPKILHDVSFDLQPGKSLALVGATGSGKSTIVKLLSKLYDQYSGHIFIDDLDLATIEPDSLRKQIAIVPQDIVLFDGTVAFNIGLGDPTVTRESIEAAARDVGADGFIRRLSGGYEHHVKERGANLSHGQRQLLAFARALARSPSLVILDEATSSVDPESEAVVQAAIARLLKGRSVIVIAHRLSTIRQCDKILVIEKGRVIESGKHDELKALGATYARLLESSTTPLASPVPS